MAATSASTVVGDAAVTPRRAAVPGRVRSAGRERTLVWTGRLLVLLVLLTAWQVYGSTSGGAFVPSLTATLAALPDLVMSGELGRALWASNASLLVGYPISVVAGLALGFLIGRRRVADRAVSYWLDIAMVVPMIATVPVVIVALGLGFTARVAVVVLFTLPVLAMNSRAAVRVVDRGLAEMAGSFGASSRQVWTSVLLPSVAPQLFTALRIGLGRAISGMVVVELTLVPVGLGGLLLDYKSSFSGASLYAVTLVIIIEGVLLTGLSQTLEGALTRRLQGRSG